MPAFLGLGPANPITWSNFYRKGGFKTFLTTSGAYFLILATLIYLSGRVDPREAARAYQVWAGLLLGLQFLFVVVIGAGRVAATVRGDVNSGMIESLRMMPLPAGHAITGYLSSPATLAGFFAANFLLGAVMTAFAQLPVTHWVAVHAIMLPFALLVWVIAAFMAFLVKSAGALLAVVSLVGVFGHIGILYVAPGMVVLAGPLIGAALFNFRTSQTELASPLILSVAAQVLVGAIFFTGAARKYRRPDALALGGWLALGLLAAVIGISQLAILQPEAFYPGYVARELGRIDPEVPFCGTTILAMLVGLIPLANLARLHVNWDRGRADDPSLRRTVPSPLPSALIVTALLATMLFVLPTPPTTARKACFVAALFGFCASVTFAAAWVYRVVDNAKVILTIWLIAYALLPLGIDLVRHSLADSYSDPVLTTISSFSPIGLVIEAASQPETDILPGAVFHLLIPLLPYALYRQATRPKPQPATAVQA